MDRCAIRKAKPGQVFLRQFRCILACLHALPGRQRSICEDCGQQAPTPRSKISNEDRCIVRDARKGRLNQNFAVRAWNQCAPIAQEFKTEKLRRANDVLQRLAGGAAQNTVGICRIDFI